MPLPRGNNYAFLLSSFQTAWFRGSWLDIVLYKQDYYMPWRSFCFVGAFPVVVREVAPSGTLETVQ